MPASEERERSPKRRRARTPDSSDASPDKRRRRDDSPRRDHERHSSRRDDSYRRGERARERGSRRSDRSRSRDRSPQRRDRSPRRRERSPRGRADRADRDGRDRRERDDDRRARHDEDRPSAAAALSNGHGDADGAAARPGEDMPGGAAAAGNGAAAAAGPAGAAGGDDVGAGPAAAVPAEVPERKAPVAGRAGGVYIPPFKLARMMAEMDDKTSPQYQRVTWDALRKSINGLINKVNVSNIRAILPEFFQENLIRGRGVFCQSMMKAQTASPSFSNVYSALMAVLNTKFPELGELLLHRVIAQFKRAYKRNDKPICMAVTKFLAHLINQGVVHEVLALEMLILMLENPSDDSVEVALEFCKEAGAFLQDVAPQGLHSVFERFRTILHEGEIDKRVQYMIEGLFAVRKAGFEASGMPAVKPELDLVDDEDRITHEMSLDDKHDPQTALNVFKVDEQYAEHEAQYAAIVKEILGEESEEEGGEGEGSSEEEEEDEEADAAAEEERQTIQDATETNLVNLRRTIYLTIMSSLDFEEAGHKLLKIQMAPGQEAEIPIMIIECASQERTYVRYYGLLGARFCMLRKEYQATFEDCFAKQYSIIHRLETNKLRNVAKLFAHLLASDAISWGVLQVVRLTEEDTTSSSRIFIKYLFQELSETLGLLKLNERLQTPMLQPFFDGIFPKDTQANMRFAINFFTSIGLGGITDKMRELYRELPKLQAAKAAAEAEARRLAAPSSSSDSDSSSGSSSSSGSDSSGSDSSGSDSSSDSESEDSRERRRRSSRSDKGRDSSHRRSSGGSRRRR